MRKYLLGRRIDDACVESVISELRAQGYLDDRRFAEALVHDKRVLGEWGRERIARELAARGVDHELIESALAEGEAEGEGETERALALLSRRFPDGFRSRHDRERALGVLLRRGYGLELAHDVLAAHGLPERVPGD